MLQLANVSKRFGTTQAVANVSLDMAAGDHRVLFGPSGCGKTTLLRLIAGLESPDSGSIRMGEMETSGTNAMLPPWDRGVGFVFQASALWPHMTVRDNILFGMDGEDTDGAEQLAKRVNITDVLDQFPPTLSGGQARRVALARALAPRPRLLLLDEPFTNLDQQSVDNLLDLTKQTANECGAMVLFVTHDQQEAQQWGAPILHMSDGRISSIDRHNGE